MAIGARSGRPESAGMGEHIFARQNDVAGALLIRTDRHIRDCQFDGGRSLHQTRGGSRNRIARPAAGVAVIGIGSSIAIVVGTHWDGMRRGVEALSSSVQISPAGRR